MNPTTPWEKFIEKGAAIEHARWSKWQEYFFSKCVMKEEVIPEHVTLCLPRELYDRWQRQIATQYAELSEAEKESDRKEVRSYLPLLKEHFIPRSDHAEQLEKSKSTFAGLNSDAVFAQADQLEWVISILTDAVGGKNEKV